MKTLMSILQKRIKFLFISAFIWLIIPDLQAQFELNIFGESGLPYGTFRQNTQAVGLGFGSSLIYPLDKERRFSVGGDFNYEIYGKESKNDASESYRMITNNNIFMMHAIIRFMPYHEGFIKPYFDLKGGFKNFYTKTKIKEQILFGESVEQISEFNDFAGSYGAGLGINFRYPERMGYFVEASFLAGGRATYVDRKSFERTPDDELVFSSKTSDTNMLVFRFGLSFYPTAQ